MSSLPQSILFTPSVLEHLTCDQDQEELKQILTVPENRQTWLQTYRATVCNGSTSIRREHFTQLGMELKEQLDVHKVVSRVSGTSAWWRGESVHGCPALTPGPARAGGGSWVRALPSLPICSHLARRWHKDSEPSIQGRDLLGSSHQLLELAAPRHQLSWPGHR